MKSKIAKKLIISTILFSSIITLFITAIQLYAEFNYDIKGINKKLEQIKISYKESISQAVWVADRSQLQLILDGITEHPDIVFAKVVFENNKAISSGSIPQAKTLELKMNLYFYYNHKNINIGNLSVIATLAGVYNRLFKRLWIILLSNAFKTSLVAIFIYFLFSQLVTRHLTKISKFSENHQDFFDIRKLKLDRNNNNSDELDTVVDSINLMHSRLHQQISEINRQKQYLSLTLNSIGDAVITTDDKGHVSSLNPVAEQLTGWSNEDAKKRPLKSIFSIVDASNRKPIDNPVDKVLATGETIYLSNHTTLIAKNGNEYQIADSAAPIRDKDNKIHGMVLVFNDVSEQYKMREALYESEQRLRQLSENLNEVFWLGSLDWNEVIYISSAYEKNWGFNAKKLYKNGRVWIDSVHPDDRQQVLNDIPKKIEAIANGIHFREYRMLKPSGEVIWVKANAYPVYDREGNLIRIAGIAEDITERKYASETMRRTQKMDALGKLTGGIAHDYNNMLGVILGYADLLNNLLSEQPKLKKYVDAISHAGERGAKLTSKLLAFSKNQSPDVKRLNINSLLSEQQHLLEKTLTVRITLSIQLENNLWAVGVDESELEDAIINISINAMHAINANGKFTIETKNSHLSVMDAKKLALDSGDYVKLSFIDTGCGIDEASKEKIFDPFYTTKGEKGTGLGLSQVYGFMNRCNGAIKVESELHKGSQFSLYFPRYDEHKDINHVVDAQQQIVTSTYTTGSERILVVDDEPAMLDLTCDILTQYGYQVLSATRAKQALDILENEKVDLLISDIIMPEMDGYQLATLVHEKYPNLKIQLVSGFSGDKVAHKVDEKFSQNILYKPFKSDVLLNKIEQIFS